MEDILKKMNELMNQQFSWVGFIDDEDISDNKCIFKIFLRVAATTKKQFFSTTGNFLFRDTESINLFLKKIKIKTIFANELGGYMCNDFSYLNYQYYLDKRPELLINYKTFDKKEFDSFNESLNENLFDESLNKND